MYLLEINLQYKWQQTDSKTFVLKTPFDTYVVKRKGFRFLLISRVESVRFTSKRRINDYIALEFTKRLEALYKVNNKQ